MQKLDHKYLSNIPFAEVNTSDVHMQGTLITCGKIPPKAKNELRSLIDLKRQVINLARTTRKNSKACFESMPRIVKEPGAPNESLVQNHLNTALLNVY